MPCGATACAAGASDGGGFGDCRGGLKVPRCPLPDTGVFTPRPPEAPVLTLFPTSGVLLAGCCGVCGGCCCCCGGGGPGVSPGRFAPPAAPEGLAAAAAPGLGRGRLNPPGPAGLCTGRSGGGAIPDALHSTGTPDTAERAVSNPATVAAVAVEHQGWKFDCAPGSPSSASIHARPRSRAAADSSIALPAPDENMEPARPRTFARALALHYFSPRVPAASLSV